MDEGFGYCVEDIAKKEGDDGDEAATECVEAVIVEWIFGHGGKK